MMSGATEREQRVLQEGAENLTWDAFYELQCVIERGRRKAVEAETLRKLVALRDRDIEAWKESEERLTGSITVLSREYIRACEMIESLSRANTRQEEVISCYVQCMLRLRTLMLEMLNE